MPRLIKEERKLHREKLNGIKSSFALLYLDLEQSLIDKRRADLLPKLWAFKKSVDEAERKAEAEYRAEMQETYRMVRRKPSTTNIPLALGMEQRAYEKCSRILRGGVVDLKKLIRKYAERKSAISLS